MKSIFDCFDICFIHVIVVAVLTLNGRLKATVVVTICAREKTDEQKNGECANVQKNTEIYDDKRPVVVGLGSRPLEEAS